MLHIEEGDQFQFEGLETGHLNTKEDSDGNLIGVSVVAGIIGEGGEIVFRQLTKTGLISKSRNKSFILTREKVEEHGTKLEGNDLVYPQFPKAFDKFMEHLNELNDAAIESRRDDIVTEIGRHIQEIDSQIQDLTDQKDMLNDKLKVYEIE